MVYFIGYAFGASTQHAVNLEMHGKYRITLLFGLELLTYGIGGAVGVPFAGKFKPILKTVKINEKKVAANIVESGFGCD